MLAFNLNVNVFLLFDPSVNIYFQNRFKIPYHSKNGKTGGGKGGGVGARSCSVTLAKPPHEISLLPDITGRSF